MHQCFALVYCGIYGDFALFQGRVTWRLESDVRRAGGSRRYLGIEEGPGSSSIVASLCLPQHDQYIPVYTSTYYFWSVHPSMYTYILVCTCTYYIPLFGTMLLYKILVWWMSRVLQVLYQLIPFHTDIYWHESTCLVSSICSAF